MKRKKYIYKYDLHLNTLIDKLNLIDEEGYYELVQIIVDKYGGYEAILKLKEIKYNPLESNPFTVNG